MSETSLRVQVHHSGPAVLLNDYKQTGYIQNKGNLNKLAADLGFL